MNSVSKTRVQLLAVFGALILVGAMVLFFVRSGRPAAPASAPPPDAAQGQPVKLPPPPPRHRYYQASDNPKFGQAFDFGRAVNGDTAELPGCVNVRAGLLVDLNNRRVLWAKNPHQAVPIASMTKMMTLLIAFETLEQRKDLSLETVVQVTPSAARIGGSQVYLDPREKFPLGELLKAVAIKSANDAAVLTADFLDGSSPVYVARMNKRAAELGMPNTHFVNACGLPDDGKRNSLSSPADMARLAERLTEYPQLMTWSATRHATFRTGQPKQLDLYNTNHLLADRGVYGFKTGYIRKSGFCITAGCRRGDKNLVAVVTGLPSSRERDRFVRGLFAWAEGAKIAPAKTVPKKKAVRTVNRKKR